LKILIADDTRVVQMIIKRSVEKCGIADLEIQTASDGQAAFDIVVSWQPDLVITDWHMPIMTGLALLKKIYANGMNHIKVGFVTAEPSKKNLEDAKRFGAAFVLNKPCTEEDIVEAVMGVVDKMPIEVQLAPSSKSSEESTVEESNLHLADSASDEAGEIIDESHLLALDDRLQSVFSKRFGDSISIESIDRKPSSEFSDTYLISLFGVVGTAGIKAICVIDKQGIYLLGALVNNKPIDEIIALLNVEGVDSGMAKLATDFLSESGSDIFGIERKKGKTEILEIKSKGVVNHLPEKVCVTIDSSVSRRDFKLSHPDYGDCFMSVAKL